MRRSQTLSAGQRTECTSVDRRRGNAPPATVEARPCLRRLAGCLIAESSQTMVQSIENRTNLQGRVRGRRADPDRPGWELLDIEVTRADPVPGLPNLLSEAVGSTIAVSVPGELLPPGDLDGASIRFRAYRGGPDAVLAEKDPASGTFSIETRN
jgi:hypothetical protein